jgi:type IV pilus assembly protein PilY1
MRLPMRLLAFVCAATMTIGNAGSAAGVTCNVPLVIGSAGADANVLILLDSSLTMNEALVSSAYNPGTRYSGNFSRTSSYDVSVSDSLTPRHFNSTWPNTPKAYLVASDQGEPGTYTGNYLNWVYFTATAAQRAAIPVVTRIQASKAVVTTVLANITGCRFAIEIFNGSTGGNIIGPFGTSVATLQSLVNGVRANSYTPLAESMITAWNYFRTSTGDPAIQSVCQKTFVIIVTDGLPTMDTTVPSYITDANRNGYYLDDVAKYMYRNDARSDLDGIQNVATFTIGFNVDASLLQTTADLGGGEYFSISDATGLMQALTRSFNTIAARVSAGAAVSVVASEDRTNNRLYRARYQSQTWKGYLEAFNLPFHGGDNPLWEAGGLLASRDASTRTILTSTTGTNTYPLTRANAASLATLLAAASTAEADSIIKYTRGDSVAGTRSRNGWKLGDIVDAAPLTVGRPNGFNTFLNYFSFRAARTGRPEVVYAAANDGMLHCFDAHTGVESWAYVPKTQLPRLKLLMNPEYCHDYFLNMTPVAYDIYLNGAWKTMLIGGEAQGGSGLFALDVTSSSPDTMSVLWDINQPALKGSWNGPSLVRDRTRGAYVLAVGTGVDTATAQTNLLVLDPANGSTLSTFALGSPVRGNKTTKATVIDRDYDTYDDLLYLGDLAGNIWRVNLAANPWSVTRLFSCGQPIQAAPTLTVDQLGRVMVFFGTGKYLTITDPTNTNQQTIYGIIDDNSGGTVTPADLVDQTTVFHGLTSGSRGWYVNLAEGAGERVTHTPSLIAGTLYVPSFRPNTTACTGGGQSWLYSLDYKDGSAPDHANGTANNTTADRVQSMGDGILADPSVDLLSEQIILQSSNAVLLTEDISAGVRKLIVRSWRQRWN